METTTPPLEVPSNLVSTMPVIPTALLKPLAYKKRTRKKRKKMKASTMPLIPTAWLKPLTCMYVCMYACMCVCQPESKET